jgi:hypothetical protein
MDGEWEWCMMVSYRGATIAARYGNDIKGKRINGRISANNSTLSCVNGNDDNAIDGAIVAVDKVLDEPLLLSDARAHERTISHLLRIIASLMSNINNDACYILSVTSFKNGTFITR